MRAFFLLTVTGVTALSACGVTVDPSSAPTVAQQVSLHPERRGIGLLPVGGAQSLAKPGLEVSVDPRRSLAVTDQIILKRFSFEEVMNRLAEQSGIPGLTGLRLYQEWWDSQRPAPGLGLGGRTLR